MASNVTETSISYPMANSRVVTITLRDKIAPDDVVVNRSKAKLLALRTGDTLDVVPLSRRLKDLMIKFNVAE